MKCQIISLLTPFLKYADSLAAQSSTDYELIVIDDIVASRLEAVLALADTLGIRLEHMVCVCGHVRVWCMCACVSGNPSHISKVRNNLRHAHSFIMLSITRPVHRLKCEVLYAVYTVLTCRVSHALVTIADIEDRTSWSQL